MEGWSELRARRRRRDCYCCVFLSDHSAALSTLSSHTVHFLFEQQTALLLSTRFNYANVHGRMQIRFNEIILRDGDEFLLLRCRIPDADFIRQRCDNEQRRHTSQERTAKLNTNDWVTSWITCNSVTVMKMNMSQIYKQVWTSNNRYSEAQNKVNASVLCEMII